MVGMIYGVLIDAEINSHIDTLLENEVAAIQTNLGTIAAAITTTTTTTTTRRGGGGGSGVGGNTSNNYNNNNNLIN